MYNETECKGKKHINEDTCMCTRDGGSSIHERNFRGRNFYRGKSPFSVFYFAVDSFIFILLSPQINHRSSLSNGMCVCVLDARPIFHIKCSEKRFMSSPFRVSLNK